MLGALINNDIICYCFISHLVEREKSERGSYCLGPSQRVGWFWKIKPIIWQDTSIFSSAVLRQENPAVARSEHPLFPSPLTSLSLSDASRLSADPYSWRDAGLSEGSCAASDSQQGEGYCPEAELQHLQQATQKQDRTWGEWNNHKTLKVCLTEVNGDNALKKTFFKIYAFQWIPVVQFHQTELNNPFILWIENIKWVKKKRNTFFFYES